MDTPFYDTFLATVIYIRHGTLSFLLTKQRPLTDVGWRCFFIASLFVIFCSGSYFSSMTITPLATSPYFL